MRTRRKARFSGESSRRSIVCKNSTTARSAASCARDESNETKTLSPPLQTPFPNVAGTQRVAISPSRSAVRRSRSTATTQKRAKSAPTAAVSNIRRDLVNPRLASFVVFRSRSALFFAANSNVFQFKRRQIAVPTLIRKERLQSSRRRLAKRRTFARRYASLESRRRIGRVKFATSYSDANSSQKTPDALAILPECAPR